MNARKRHKVLAIALAIAMPLALLGQTVAVEQDTTNEEIVTGHSTFLSASTSFNSCFAGVSGLLLQRVTWFNGQPLFERATDGGGNTWIYLTEGFVNDGDGYDEETGIRIRDPSTEKLYETDNTYKFKVPGYDSYTWVVQEYFALRQQDVANEANVGADGVDGEPKRVYVFAVKVASESFEFKDTTVGSSFNFVSVVDTCRFHGSPIEDDPDSQHDNEDKPGDGGDPMQQHDQTPEDGGTHPHGVYAIDIWVGGAPDSVPCVDTTGQEQTPDERQCVPDDRSGKEEDPGATSDAGDGSP